MADKLGSRDNDMLAYARGAARQIKQSGPTPGALGNTGSGSPDFDKGELPSDTTRPAFAEGGAVGDPPKRSEGNIGDPPKRSYGNVGADPPQRSYGNVGADPPQRSIGARNLDPLPPGRALEGIYKLEQAPRFAAGGMVKHGSSTRVTCNNKHRG